MATRSILASARSVAGRMIGPGARTAPASSPAGVAEASSSSRLPVDARERFDAWVSDGVAPVLGGRAFTKTRNTFHLRGPDGWAVINFQCSAYGNRDLVRFTVNLSVALDCLAVDRDRDPSRKPPSNRGDWWMRIGFLAGSPPVTLESDLEPVSAEVLPLVTEALPLLSERLTVAGFAATIGRERSIGHVRGDLAAVKEMLATQTTGSVDGQS